MSDLKNYYEQYWSGGHDVSDTDATTPERKKRLLATLKTYLDAKGRVLDLGCGGGQFTHALAAAGYAAVGMDISDTALSLARRQYPHCQFQCVGTEGAIPAEAAAFDAVWTTEVIEHILDVRYFLAEIDRVLKQDGLLILTTPYHGRLKNLIIASVNFDTHFDPEGSHIRFFDKKGLERCLEHARFKPVLWSGIGRCWGLYKTWFVVARKEGHE